MPTAARPLTLALLLTLVATAAAEAQFSWFGLAGKPKAEIAWSDDPAEALAAAVQSGKPVLAYVTSENCRFCSKMEKETWSEPAIGRLVGRSFVALKLHADKHPDEVAALGVKAFPTTVLISPDGKAFAGKTGFMEPLQLTELLRPAIAQRPAPGLQTPPVR